jgi:hypothetical protein
VLSFDNSVAVQERLYRSQADCECNILCCLARRFGNLNRIKFTRNNPDDAAAPVQTSGPPVDHN